MRQRQHGITVMASMLTNGFGIISAGTSFHWANLRPIQWKATTQNCDIIWHAWLANRVAFLAALMPWNVLCACSFIVSTVGSFTNSSIQIIQLTLWTSLAHYFSHSLPAITTRKLENLCYNCSLRQNSLSAHPAGLLARMGCKCILLVVKNASHPLF